MTQTVIVASKNPVKIDATRLGFNQLFPKVQWNVHGANIPSGVSDQPMSDEETLRGAQNRARNAQANYPVADYWVGIEGGCAREYGKVWVFAWIVVCSRDQMELGRTSSFVLPDNIVEHLDQGLELGHATDRVYGEKDSKRRGGVVGALSHGHIDRTEYYVQPMILALMGFFEQ